MSVLGTSFPEIEKEYDKLTKKCHASALHPGIFDQPAKNGLFTRLIRSDNDRISKDDCHAQPGP